METELQTKLARKLSLLIRLEEKIDAMYGKHWEYNPHPTCHVITVYINIFKEINVLLGKIEKLPK